MAAPSEKAAGRARDSVSAESEGGEAGGTSSLLRDAPSVRPAGAEAAGTKGGWDAVKDSVVGGAFLKFVGLKPYKQEQRHWGAIKESIRVGRLFSESPPTPSTQSSQQQQQPGAGRPSLMRQSSVITSAKTSLPPGDVAAVHHLTTYPYGVARQASVAGPAPPHPHRAFSETDDKPAPYSKLFSDPGATMTRASLYNKGTGRNQAVRAEVKPDLWKLALNSITNRTTAPPTQIIRPRAAIVTDSGTMGRSFIDLGDYSDTEDVDYDALPGTAEEDFFGGDSRLVTDHGIHEATDSAPLARFQPAVVSVRPSAQKSRPPPTSPPAEPGKRRRNRLEKVTDPIFKGGYDRGRGGGLGLFTLLLRFKYKHIPKRVQIELDKLLHKRPYFTYWLIMVHILIMIVSLSVYGIAPYGWDLFTERASIQQTNLASDIVERTVVPNVWLGPPQRSLVLLGALYGPCMRRDRQLYAGIENDRQVESNSSGCCVRRDNSGCVQQLGSEDCPPRFADFVFNVSDTRAVCGTSPTTCVDPDPNLSPPDVWQVDEIRTWPICREDLNSNASASHLSCEVTGRPCCVGIQAFCLITTREHCDFLEGRFHQDAFLCSQVVCLDEGICGLLPFLVPDHPDQVYRLWIPLVMHAGLFHLLLSVLFNLVVLRSVEKRLGWFYTAFIYVLSGIGGNLVSAYFVPYNPAVGPAGCSLGIIAYLFVFLIFESRLLESPWMEFLKLGAITLVLFLFGLLPYFDNFAHIGGFVFGFFISGVVLPYGEYRKVFDPDMLEQDNRTMMEIEREKKTNRSFLVIKIVLVVLGLVIVPLLFALFFVLFYVVQDTWSGFSFLTCIPFTSTICLDMQAAIRARDMTTFVV